ncbi:protein kinase domain-containing protein [Thiolapillus sp.]
MDADLSDVCIPGYKILSLIGEGANATVYLAMQESLNRPVALKILQKFDHPAQAVRFFNEGQIVASMNHPNIITIYDIGSVGSQQYIAMEYLENGSLRDRVKAGVSPGTALDIVQSIGSALEFVHQMGIVHRDIKPENILFHKSGIPKITDFGVAKALDRDMNLTMDGTALGSPYYLSPEQAEGKDLDGRSDIYSLGVILFELLAQRKPYLGESQIEVIFGHLNKPIPSLPEKHLQYQSLVEKMMAKDANNRFSSVKEMLEYVNAFRDLGENRSSRRTADLEKKKPSRSNRNTSASSWFKRPLFITTAAGIVAAIAVTVLIMNRPSTPSVSASTPVDVTQAQQPEQTRQTVYGDAPAQKTTEHEEKQVTLDTPMQPVLPPSDGEFLTPVTDMDTEATIAEAETGETIEETAGGLNGEITEDLTGGENPEDAAPVANIEETVAQEETIASLMQKAEEALKKYRLTSPKNSSAYYYYRKILKLAPGNKAASQGIRKLAGKYGILSDKALQKEDEKKARSYLERGLRIRPRDKALLARMAHLDELEAARLAPPPPPPPPPEPVKPPPEPEPVNTSLQLLESLE